MIHHHILFNIQDRVTRCLAKMVEFAPRLFQRFLVNVLKNIKERHVEVGILILYSLNSND